MRHMEKRVNSKIRQEIYIVYKPNITLKEKVHQQQYKNFVHCSLDEVQPSNNMKMVLNLYIAWDTMVTRLTIKKMIASNWLAILIDQVVAIKQLLISYCPILHVYGQGWGNNQDFMLDDINICGRPNMGDGWTYSMSIFIEYLANNLYNNFFI